MNYEDKIIHLAIDEKFLDSEFIPNLLKVSNFDKHFFIVVYNSKINFPISHKNINFIYIKKSEIDKFLKDTLPFKKLIIHGFIDEMRKPILKLPKNIVITVIVYGFEFYSKINGINLFKRETKKILKIIAKKNKLKIERPKDLIYRKIYEIKQKKNIKKSFIRIDIIAHYIPREFLLFKRKLNLNAKLLDFNLGSYENIFPDLEISYQKNILIGNSADPTNNHIDTMKMINTSEIKNNTKVYCPLSYANNGLNYIEKVIDYGQNKFGHNFHPLKKFLLKNDFVKILQTCEFIILNHHRSQGVLSAFAAFYFKKDLYLSKKNPFYHYASDLGMKIFVIEEGINFKNRLTEEEKINNKNLYINNFNLDIVLKKYKKLIS